MSTEFLYLGIGAAIWAIGLHGLLMVHHLLRRIIAFNLMGSGTFLVLVALAARTDPPDPMLQALVVTGLVVSISATAFAVRLANARAQHGSEAARKGAAMQKGRSPDQR
ncbi:NADH-quinone oxidoreductase subunit K [Gilvimarinus sp. F26214L]|uniref:NADH-quinone oxidoreductase subunit K n=1 Tax=Gilvimarinus sp. DZF01 TaxID=3461371 RepID=UPI0040451C23